jgi:hypothetical protein
MLRDGGGHSNFRYMARDKSDSRKSHKMLVLTVNRIFIIVVPRGSAAREVPMKKVIKRAWLYVVTGSVDVNRFKITRPSFG